MTSSPQPSPATAPRMQVVSGDYPSAYEEILRAFDRAKLVVGKRTLPLKIGIVDEDDQMLMEGTLVGLRQVKAFTDSMKKLGYREELLGGMKEAQGCDVLYVPVGGVDHSSLFPDLF